MIDTVTSNVQTLSGQRGLVEGFPFVYLNEQSSFICDLWTVRAGRSVDSKATEYVSIFVAEKSPAHLSLLRNSVHKLKTIRHPSILRFLASVETEHQLLMATEQISPVVNFLNSLGTDLRLDALRWITTDLFVQLFSLSLFSVESIAIFAPNRRTDSWKPSS